VIHGLYTAALGVFVVAYAPYALYRRLARGVPVRLRERVAYGARAGAAPPTAWIHAVSVGEAIAAAPLVDGLRRRYPELPVVVTTVTETGARVVRERYGAVATHRFFPLDFPGAVRRAVEAINPAFLVVMETELWPNLLRHLARRGVPVLVVNGRLSDRSFRRYRRVRWAMRRVLADVSVFAMQSQEDARRVIALGADPERVVVTGNVKHEAVPDREGGAEVWTRLLGLRPGQPVWIAGSTHRGEEDPVLQAHGLARRDQPELVLVLAPRHPERVPEVLDAVRAAGWTGVRRTELPRARAADSVIVVDTVGELAQLYAVADVVFVGGSLVPAGGHNVLEAALQRKPVLFGPHMENFREAAAVLVDHGGGLVVAGGADLAGELRRLLRDPGLRAKIGQAGAEAVLARHGAVERTLELVERLRGGVR
jgi:3-deoxy-D-manno-octulosonic-acid transferase